MGNWSNILVVLAVLAMMAAIRNQTVEAKRGCATFGHSCYGGMGKRSGEVINPSTEDFVEDTQQQEDNPEIVFTGPRSEYKNEQMRQLTKQDIYDLSPYIRQWLKSIRNAETYHNIHRK